MNQIRMTHGRTPRERIRCGGVSAGCTTTIVIDFWSIRPFCSSSSLRCPIDLFWPRSSVVLKSIIMDPFGDERVDAASEEEDHEQDPAAAFIAQQRSLQAGLEDDDFEKVNSNDNGFGAFGDTTENGPASGVMEMNQEDLQPNYNLGGEDNSMDGYGKSNGFSSSYEPPKIRPSTPDKIRKWREEQTERLAKKDADEEKRKQELREQARKELEDWYRLEAENVKKAKKNNREAEKDFVQQRDSDKKGEEWERVARLCDFNPKSAKGTKDVSRLRSIILQLKQSPSSQ